MDFGVSTAALTVAAAAIGAVQLAAIAAQPIPKYARGRDGGPAELAFVGDGGRREVIMGKDGKAFTTPSRATLAWLEKGDTVFSSIPSFEEYARMTAVPESVREMAEKPIPMNVNVDFSKMVEEQKRSTREIKEAIKNQNTLQINSTRRGIYETIKKAGGGTSVLINRRYNNR
jgi:hypothetical protein